MTEPHQSSGWPHPGSPFHSAELELQERFGARARLEVGARLGIRDYMPDQHRAFFAGLPLLFLGARDTDGQPWATVVEGAPGFIQSPEPRLLQVGALPLPSDPTIHALQAGRSVGTLGLEPATRRRNRMNGDVVVRLPDGFSIRVVQSYGNCPQYIQARDIVSGIGVSDRTIQANPLKLSDVLSDEDVALLERSDTFFIATGVETDDKTTGGTDVSHRGGKPGFIRVNHSQVLTTPDFKGNFFFNTLGNLVRDPRAGLLVIDFDTGDLLQMSARAHVIWSGPEVERYTGAQRVVRFTIERVRRTRAALPMRWGSAEFAPQITRTGDW